MNKTITCGVILSLSGEYENLGTEVLQGIEVAVDPGFGVPDLLHRLVPEDEADHNGHDAGKSKQAPRLPGSPPPARP